MKVKKPRLLGVGLVCCLWSISPEGAQEPRGADFNAGTVRATVVEVATIVSREYMDAAVGERLAASLRRRLNDGAYVGATTPEALAKQLTSDLMKDSLDKHLAVTPIRGTTPAAPAAVLPRTEAARRDNGGVQRVEVLAGNVGYLNLTAFWRVDEARDAITDAMRLLQRADALIIDMRQNRGGSPETVVLLAGYFFDQGGLPLFDIVPRSGDRVAYATADPAPPERDSRRPVYVLTSSRTFSAGEGFAFLVQERERGEVIGERTAGAANPGRSYRVNSMFEVIVPNGRVRSAIRGGNWEGTGVIPNREVAESDALPVAHARALERLNRKPG